jgi:hypothetical protein
MKNFNILYTNKPQAIKYKRILFYGVTDLVPTIEDIFDAFGLFYDDTGREEFLWAKSRLFPALIQWETLDSEKKYAEITKVDTRTDKADRR